MPLLRPVRLALMLALALTVGAAAVPDAFAKPRDPPTLYPPPPPPPPTPGVGLGARFVQDAAAYMGYMRDTSAISPAFTDASDVARSLRQGVAYEPGQLRRGAVAYAAIAALDDPVFVADLRRAGSTAENRYAIIARIYANPAYAMQFADGANAAGLAKQALATTGMLLFNDGDAVTSEAYSMQHQPWSLVAVVGLAEREAAAKGLSATPRLPADADDAALARRVLGDTSGAPPLSPAAGPYSPLVVRAVALAALAAIGQAGDAQAGNLGWLTDDYFMDHCLSETKLSLFECLAVAKPNYEDAFCLGQHAMKDTGSCLVRAAGAAVPLVILTNPIKIPPAHIGEHAPVRRRR
ncbi:MAG TPA: hypothetical protein VHW60_06205 [Caulobacteraceae bacterium]|jgi:hypothetical protein|nr:hypothetical protein [Caulobacteraceae bacterium]